MMRVVKNNKGMSLVELVVVLSIASILAIVGVPQYGVFMAKGKVKKATTDLLQNIKLARTMAIKENRQYMITFEVDNTDPNNIQYIYRIGQDADGDGSLTGATDNYGGHDVVVYNLQDEYGSDVVFGKDNLTYDLPNGPNSIDVSDAGTYFFNPDGSSSSTDPLGTVYIQHNSASRGYTYCVELANAAGTVNLYMWQGDAYHYTEENWTEIR